MSKLTPEMQQWLQDNRADYEFYLLHSMFHNVQRRFTYLAVPVTPDDFSKEEYAMVMYALIAAVKITGAMGQQFPVPPSREFMRTYLESAARFFAADDEEVAGAMQLLEELQNPKYTEMHYCLDGYFEAWYGAVRGKRAAREIQKIDVPNVGLAVGEMQAALAAAREASRGEEDDPMQQFLNDEEYTIQPRRSTGVEGLDNALNGGWGDRECYLVFSGTKGGKSILAGQCAWHEARFNDGWPLIVSTELWPRDYGVRTVSNAAGVPINKIQDCGTMAQVRQAVAGDPSLSFRLGKVDEVMDRFRERFRIAKVGAADGMDARAVIEREVIRYEAELGRPPTWVALDWLGTMADVGGGKQSSSERSMAWEYAATGCVKFSEDSGIPLLVLAQAVNDAQLKRILTLNDIGIAKGIGKNMTAVIGVTNTIDQAGIKAAMTGKADMPQKMFLDEQFFCVCAARKGEGANIPVTRQFNFQRFTERKRD